MMMLLNRHATGATTSPCLPLAFLTPDKKKLVIVAISNVCC